MSSFHPKPSEQMCNLLQHEVKITLEKKNHFFIVIMGAVIGAIFALFIDYHIDTAQWHYLFITTLPFVIAYILRKVYIHTLSQIGF